MNKEKNLFVRDTIGTTSMMLDVIVALSPVLIWGVVAFGLRALAVVLIASASASLYRPWRYRFGNAFGAYPARKRAVLDTCRGRRGGIGAEASLRRRKMSF